MDRYVGFICCGEVRSVRHYRAHMDAAHEGRSFCVLHLSFEQVVLYLLGASIAELTREAITV